MYKVCNLVFYWIVTGSWWKSSGADVNWSAEKNKCTKTVVLSFIGSWRGHSERQVGQISGGQLRIKNQQWKSCCLFLDVDGLMIKDMCVRRSVEKNNCTKTVIYSFIGWKQGWSWRQGGQMSAGLLRRKNVKRQWFCFRMDSDRGMVENKLGRCRLVCWEE